VNEGWAARKGKEKLAPDRSLHEERGQGRGTYRGEETKPEERDWGNSLKGGVGKGPKSAEEEEDSSRNWPPEKSEKKRRTV